MNGVRQARVWKRFVRVRTDDLESVRVERAIKRRRSDLASHLHSPAVEEPITNEKVEETLHTVVEPTLDWYSADDGTLKEDAAIARAVMEDLSLDTSIPDSVPNTSTTGPDPVPSPTDVVTVEEEQRPSSPLPLDADGAPAPEPSVPRFHRSQSADPDQARRLSRTYTSSNTLDGMTTTTTSSQTGDDSSISTSDKRRNVRKKRSMSTDPSQGSAKRARATAQRKVLIDDFEMMRVLGKGCAGKVLLVRHKSTAELYALKAITKRHVLAHQELQHTLTEQAVLKRMAAEARDPFVVKLWWSFHDKENLFLVMVSVLGCFFFYLILVFLTHGCVGFPSWW